jgi:pimeloyl-ACP methyl ester carboxylesterase
VTSFDIDGTTIAARLAGNAGNPAVLLVHGFPSSSRMFRDVLGDLSRMAFVVAPDLPGFGESAMVHPSSFSRFTEIVERLLEKLGVGSFYLYLHDFGAVVGLDLAMRQPHRIRGLIIQNANAHHAGLGPEWADTIDFWRNPTAESAQKATAHLTAEGTRYQYVGGLPAEIAARVDPRCWLEDWSVMTRPGRLEMHRALILDYRHHVDRFEEIGSYLKEHQPPSLLLWGRHDAFFRIDEALCWMKALPRMEAHVLDGPHFLLETHARTCAELMMTFIAARERASTC